MLNHFKNTTSLKDIELFKVTNVCELDALQQLAIFAGHGNEIQINIKGNIMAIELDNIPVAKGDYLYLNKDNKLSVLPASFIESNFELINPAPECEVTEVKHDYEEEEEEKEGEEPPAVGVIGVISEDECEDGECEDKDDTSNLNMQDLAVHITDKFETDGVEAELDTDNPDSISILFSHISEDYATEILNYEDECRTDYALDFEANRLTDGYYDVIITIS